MTESESINTQITDDPFASVRIAEYRYLMLGRFLFVMALRMTTTVVGWWIYKLTKDPFAIGLIGLSEVIPALSLALYSGHRVDVADKRKIILTTVSGFFVLAVILYYLSGAHAAILFPNKQIALFIYGVFFVNGILRSFTGPAMGAMIAFIVPKNLLQNATVWSQGSFLSASVTGHAIGGFSIALIGVNNTFLLISGIILAGIFSFRQLKPKPPQVAEGDQSTWQSVMEGLVFVYKTRALFGAMALDMFAVLFGGAVAMIPVYASDILKVGPLGFGWLNAATDIGAITIVILLTFFPMKRAQGRKMLLAVGGFGVCIILFGLSKWFWLSFGVLLISGMLDGISVVVRGTVMQLLTPDPMRGRVSSVSGMFILSSNELGQFESGLASRILGVIPSVVFGGFMTLSVVITTWFKAPTLRKFEY
jgi:MFS family permease